MTDSIPGEPVPHQHEDSWRHPQWCSPTLCWSTGQEVFHRGEPVTVTLAVGPVIVIQQCRSDEIADDGTQVVHPEELAVIEQVQGELTFTLADLVNLLGLLGTAPDHRGTAAAGQEGPGR